jgi:hypothetical protein
MTPKEFRSHAESRLAEHRMFWRALFHEDAPWEESAMPELRLAAPAPTVATQALSKSEHKRMLDDSHLNKMPMTPAAREAKQKTLEARCGEAVLIFGKQVLSSRARSVSFDREKKEWRLYDAEGRLQVVCDHRALLSDPFFHLVTGDVPEEWRFFGEEKP